MGGGVPGAMGGTFYTGEITNLGFSNSKGFKNFIKINEKLIIV